MEDVFYLCVLSRCFPVPEGMELYHQQSWVLKLLGNQTKDISPHSSETGNMMTTYLTVSQISLEITSSM
jgi:hypothetical protein